MFKVQTPFFQHCTRKPKYKQNNMRHQISRHKIIQYLKFLILISHIDFLIFWLPDVIHKSYCTPDEAMDPTFQLNMSQPSIVFVAGDIIQTILDAFILGHPVCQFIYLS